MTIAARISHRLGFCPEEEAEELREAVLETGLPTDPPPFPKMKWTGALEVDKKSREGMIRFVFLRRIGEVTVQAVRPKELTALL